VSPIYGGNGSMTCPAPSAWVPFATNADLPTGVVLYTSSFNVTSAWGAQQSCVGVRVLNSRVVFGESVVFELHGPTLDALGPNDTLTCVVSTAAGDTELQVNGTTCTSGPLFDDGWASGSLVVSVFPPSQSDTARSLRGSGGGRQATTAILLLQAPLTGLFSVSSQVGWRGAQWQVLTLRGKRRLTRWRCRPRARAQRRRPFK